MLGGQRYPKQTRMIDLGPTVRDLAGLPPVATTMGESLAPLLRGTLQTRSVPPAISELYDVGREMRSLRTGTSKFIHDSTAVQKKTWFDLTTDPEEKKRRPVRPTDRSRHLDKQYLDAQAWLLKGIERRPQALRQRRSQTRSCAPSKPTATPATRAKINRPLSCASL